MQKIDPYLNVDPGTMSPFQHGEVFVTDDGHEGRPGPGALRALHRRKPHARLQLHPRLHLSERSSPASAAATSCGGTVQVIPHVTNAIKERVYRHRRADERRYRHHRDRRHGRRHREPAVHRGRSPVQRRRKDPANVLFRPRDAGALHRRGARGENQAHAAFRQGAAQRWASSPTSSCAAATTRSPTSVRDEDRPVLRRRPERRASRASTRRASTRCPSRLHEQGFDEKVLRTSGPRRAQTPTWRPGAKYLVEQQADVRARRRTSRIVGKYVAAARRVSLRHRGAASCGRARTAPRERAPRSMREKLDRRKRRGGAWRHGRHPRAGRLWPARIRGQDLQPRATHARTTCPYLGICLGLQAAVCEFARDVGGHAGRDVFGRVRRETLEYPVIDLMPDQEDVDGQGRHHALGRVPVQGRAGHASAFDIYGEDVIYERHRHRYEVNNAVPQQAP